MLYKEVLYAPVNNADNTSPIQISPIENYSVDNITDINIKLYFSNNTLVQLDIPYMHHCSVSLADKHHQTSYLIGSRGMINILNMSIPHSSIQQFKEQTCLINILHFLIILCQSLLFTCLPGETALSVVNVRGKRLVCYWRN